MLGYAGASAVGLILILANVSGIWELVAALVVVLGVIQILRGLVRKAWLCLGGTDRPLKTFLERRLRR